MSRTTNPSDAPRNWVKIGPLVSAAVYISVVLAAGRRAALQIWSGSPAKTVGHVRGRTGVEAVGSELPYRAIATSVRKMRIRP